MNEKTLAIIVKARDQASRTLEKVGHTVSKVMKTAAVAVAAAGAAFTVFGIKSASDLEQTRIGLENMLGSADNARKVLKKVSDFAAKTPFEFPELAGATKQLVAFGFTGEDAFDTMKRLGDVSAAIGAPIGDLSYLMGTLKTQGRAFTIDIRQFAQRGVPIYEYLAKAMGTTEEAMSGLIEEGKVGFPEVQKAFQLMTEEGGKFHGAMEKQSTSLSGLFSTLKDNIGQAARQFIGISESGDVQKGSIFDIMRQTASQLIEALPGIVTSIQDYIGQITTILMELGRQVWDYLGPKIENLWKQINDNLIPAFLDLWHNVIEPLLPVLGELLVGAIGGVIDAAAKLIEWFGYVYQKIKDGDPFWTGLIAILATVSTALALSAGVAAFTKAMGIITTVTIPAVIAQFGAMAAVITGPIVMPAIAVGAALAALWSVKRAAEDARAAIEGASRSAEIAGASDASAIKAIRNSTWMTPQQKAQKIREIADASAAVVGNAAGTNYSSGGRTLVGEYGPEEVILPRGAKVIPNKQSKLGGGTFNMYGNIVVDSEARMNELVNRLSHMKEMGSYGAGV